MISFWDQSSLSSILGYNLSFYRYILVRGLLLLTLNICCIPGIVLYLLLHSESYLDSNDSVGPSIFISEKSSNGERKNNSFIIHYHNTSSYFGIFLISDFPCTFCHSCKQSIRSLGTFFIQWYIYIFPHG